MPTASRILLVVGLLAITACTQSITPGAPLIDSTHQSPTDISPTRSPAAPLAPGESTEERALNLTPLQKSVSEQADKPLLTPTMPGVELPPSKPIVSTLEPDEWKNLPVVPTISASVIEIYQRGLELGNNPHAFSKIGDCGSTPAWFLGDFDADPKYYQLGDHHYLSTVIQQFQGSFSRRSLGAKSGFNVSSILSPIWADRSQCEANESPLACEYRVNQPSIAFIMVGSNDVFHPDEFEPGLREIIEYSIASGIIPILATKADNSEGDGTINATIARLAREYDLPLWNYWRAVQSLPNQGLQEDGVHLTWGPNRFDDPKLLQLAWPVRNLTALQVLDALRQVIQNQP
jgi:hypothetical protein